MYKKYLTGCILLTMTLLSGCAQHDALNDKTPPPISDEEQAIQKDMMQTIETDLYTIKVPDEWLSMVNDYGDDIVSGDIVFMNKEGEIIGGSETIMSINDSLEDIMDKIKVVSEKRQGDWVVGKIEVVGNALGGDTTGVYHVMVPLDSDTEIHEYIDIFLDGEYHTLDDVLTLAHSVVIRQRQEMGYVGQLDAEKMVFYPAEIIEDAATGQFLIVRNEQRQETLSLAAEVTYYLVKKEERIFVEVDGETFKGYLKENPEELFDVTITDGQVVSIEQRLL